MPFVGQCLDVAVLIVLDSCGRENEVSKRENDVLFYIMLPTFSCLTPRVPRGNALQKNCEGFVIKSIGRPMVSKSTYIFTNLKEHVKEPSFQRLCPDAFRQLLHIHSFRGFQ